MAGPAKKRDSQKRDYDTAPTPSLWDDHGRAERSSELRIKRPADDAMPVLRVADDASGWIWD